MTWRIHHKAVTASTNLDARAGRTGDVFTADEQTAGRGRLDHAWHSAPGENLMFSAVLDVSGLAPDAVATLPLVVGLAVLRALNHEPQTTNHEPRFTVKWPNDVLAHGRKIAGILCERTGDAVIAGVGVNVNQTEFPPEIDARATSLARETGRRYVVPEVLDCVLRELDGLVSDWRRGGFAFLAPAFAPVDALKGKYVRVFAVDGDSDPVEGVCGGIMPDGTLDVGGVPVYAGEAHVAESGRDWEKYKPSAS